MRFQIMKFVNLFARKLLPQSCKINIRHLSRQSSHGHERNRTVMAILVPLVAGSSYAVHQYLWEVNCEPEDEKISAILKSKELKGRTLNDAISESRDIAQRIKDEVGSPGLSIAVSVDGKPVWSEGLGYADVENRVRCHSGSVMRIASISKPITMMLVARLMEEGKLNLDSPVQQYVPSWPKKEFNGEEVNVTTRQLVSHISGVRHYDKTCKKHKEQRHAQKAASHLKTQESKNEKDKSISKKKDDEKKDKEVKSDLDEAEYYISKHYPSVAAALALFKDDLLCSKPGSEYLYSSHGWTLVSAVVEGAGGSKFTSLIKDLFKELGMMSTYLDENDPLIYNRAKQYVKSKSGRLLNSRYVDCSYKWAAGGLLSTAGDLVKFGNIMLYSYQNRNDEKAGLLKPETVKTIWTPVENTVCDWDTYGYYGMGWCIIPRKMTHPYSLDQRFYVSHTGSAIGGSSVLLVLPREESEHANKSAPRGVVVAMMCNMQSVGLNKTALQIAKLFDAAV